VNSSCNACTDNFSIPITVTLPSAAFTPLTPVCALTAVPFTCAGPATNYYNWNFGDGYQSNTQNTTHTFGTIPTPPYTTNVTLTVTDNMGCFATATQSVVVNPPLTVSILGAKDICPGQTAILSTSPGGFSTYQWYYNGNPIAAPAGIAATYAVSSPGNYYVVVTSNSGGCVARSAIVTIKLKHVPVADILPVSRICLSGGTGTVYLQNSVNSDPNASYSWNMISGPAAVTFTPNNSNPASSTSATFTLPGDYVIVLTATDITTGCSAYDTVCVKAYNSPLFTVPTPVTLCEGTPHTFTALPNTLNYVWSNGITGNTMTTSLAGVYDVTGTDAISGCSLNLFAGTINPRPDVSLFPLSDCDTLCDTVKLLPPLPLNSLIGQTYGIYTIQWYDGVNPIPAQPGHPYLDLSLLLPNPGQHNIHVVVTNAFGCSSTSGNYKVYIKHCGNCDCKESHWGEITLTPGENPVANNNGGGKPITLSCKKNYVLECNKPYSINASYFCKDTACNGKVTYSLQPPTGTPITGTLALNFTPTQNGVYILTLYGWCGKNKCDSCIIEFTVKCNPCDCKESHWGDIVLTPGDNNAVANVGGGKPVILKCKSNYTLECNKPWSINATYLCKDSNCNGKVTYSLQPPTGLPVTGTLALNFTPNQNGVYILTLYGWCGGKKCDSCTIDLTVKCDPCDCKGSKWGDIVLSQGDNGGNNPALKANIPVQQKLKCNGSYKLECNKPVTINANFICKDSACNSNVTYSFQPPTGLPLTGNLALNFTPTQTGTYVLTLYGWCGNKICDSCVIKFEVTCVPCDCKGSHWGEMTVSDGVNKQQLSCKKEYKWKCNVPFTVNATYNCAKPDCNSAVTYTLILPSGSPQTGTLALTYTPVQSGTYTLLLYGMCGGKICDTCTVKFIVDCPPRPCCPYTITVKDPMVQLSTITNPNATVVNGNFGITGPAGNIFTEVRAEVMSYNISSNFNNECLNCKTYPYTWASIYQAGNIGAVTPQITMYNSFAASFNPAGNGMYQNPREVSWTSGTPFVLPANINLQFLLPSASIIDCCELTARICVKFIFRNTDCQECEVVNCFTVLIKPGGIK
jgi:hypothetical protein